MDNIESKFDFFAINDQKKESIALLRTKFKEMAVLIEQHVPKSREQSLALTKLEETSMWTNKGISHN
jgi:hypothetical protein